MLNDTGVDSCHTYTSTRSLRHMCTHTEQWEWLSWQSIQWSEIRKVSRLSLVRLGSWVQLEGKPFSKLTDWNRVFIHCVSQTQASYLTSTNPYLLYIGGNLRAFYRWFLLWATWLQARSLEPAPAHLTRACDGPCQWGRVGRNTRILPGFLSLRLHIASHKTRACCSFDC